MIHDEDREGDDEEADGDSKEDSSDAHDMVSFLTCPDPGSVQRHEPW